CVQLTYYLGLWGRESLCKVMARGVFVDICMVDELLLGEVGSKMVHISTREQFYMFQAAQ
ncbi:hypothetical protein MKX01_015247, partial [Papaver californicum]